MKILVIGSGAREHALVKALQRSPQSPEIFCCGTAHNPGIQALTQKYWVGNICDVAEIAKIARDWKIDLAIIGPEAPLEKGLADVLWENHVPTIGPKQKLAQIETSKSFARDLLTKYNIPGSPLYSAFNDLNQAKEFLRGLGENNFVIKADGLMGGKGVKVAGEHLHSIAEGYQFCEEIIAHRQSFVIEEKLIGQEFSLLSFCDGENLIFMPVVQDHKRAFLHDKGPNTGGMGSYSDADHRLPFLSAAEVSDAQKINIQVIQALKKEFNEKYIGFLYGSFIATKTGVRVIEFNARLGDPEALNVLSLLESDFVTICQALVSGNLRNELVRFSSLATVCKYAVPEGYPEHPVKNVEIDVSHIQHPENLFLAAVDVRENKLIATGSRTAAVVGIAKTIAEAEKIAEAEIRKIQGPLFHREDIGTEPLIRERVKHMQELRQCTV